MNYEQARALEKAVVQAARSLDRALDETVESALWLDPKDSRRVYRARCRLDRALRAYDALAPGVTADRRRR